MKKLIAALGLVGLIGCENATSDTMVYHRVLTISAAEYAESQGKKATDYNLAGIFGTGSFNKSCYQQLFSRMNEDFGPKAVIVDYTYSWSGCRGTVMQQK